MREFFHPTGPLPVSELRLDTNNFRYKGLNSQDECLKAMLTDDRSYIIAIAQDIAENGLSIDPIVLSKDIENNWIVREGNRRVAALKMLNNPSCIYDDKKHIKFVKMAEEYEENIPSEIDCWYSDNEDAILEYLDRVHTGMRGGIGRMNWTSESKARYDVHRNRTSPNALAIKAKEHAINEGVNLSDNFKITNLQRFLNDKKVQTILNMKWDGDNILFAFDSNLAKPLLIKIVEQISTINVKAIYHTEDRQEIAQNILSNLGVKPEDRINDYQAIESGDIGSYDSSSSGRDTNIPKSYVSRKPSWDRKRLIPIRNRVNIPEGYLKERNILAELSRKLDVRETPLAAALLLRALLEFSVKHYIEINDVKSDNKLSIKASKAIRDMKKKDLISEQETRNYLRLSEDHSLFSASSLHSYVHSNDFHPDSQSLCNFWDNIEKFISLCWK